MNEESAEPRASFSIGNRRLLIRPGVRHSDHYRQLLEDGTEDGPATRLTLEKFTPDLEESDSIALIAFAVTQSKLGRLEPDVRDRALAIIDVGADLGATGIEFN